ncbi:hypothetical protein A7U60_g7070 [Sanghuangporus baumii]|uniref:Carbohydrate esterase family 16 protein n=1 Tax=Sanghuangporus baumii TaxID=108892 RepID=A0A9Q5N5U7_SANBA|nr:hypothetical protein A7U60_g7070 [Sanghuangporus baumii]
MTRFTSVVGEHWPGYDGLKRLFIFGDSYSAVGYYPGWPAPSESEPLGIPFPGQTWTEGDMDSMGDSTNANWVGHLVSFRRKDGKSLLVYDYAVGGHTINGMKSQVEKWFLPHAGKRPSWAPWDSKDSLFVTWVGINDCAYSRRHEENMKNLFALEDELYEVGARNFLLIDVPPMHLSPAFRKLDGPSNAENSSAFVWNEELHKGAKTFYEKHPDISLLMYSSWDIFNKVHENLGAFGFTKSDVKKRSGRIWMDHIHPTSRMHAIIADDLDEFLKKFQTNPQQE